MKISSSLVAAVSALFLLTACEPSPDGSGTAGSDGSMGTGNSGAYSSSSVQELAPGVADRVFFDYDSSVITGEGQDVLSRQAEWLKQNSDISVTVEGHCDERGTREYNIALGERRASAAKKYLVSQGVRANRISTISYGKERPAVVGSNESAWSENRRAVTVVTNR